MLSYLTLKLKIFPICPQLKLFCILFDIPLVEGARPLRADWKRVYLIREESIKYCSDKVFGQVIKLPISHRKHSEKTGKTPMYIKGLEKR
jgi:hypothetical protein